MRKHKQVRERADQAYKRNAHRMRLKYEKQHEVKEFRVGEYVSVCVPRIDRASTDLQRLSCVVVEVIRKARVVYRLRCKFGVLKLCYDVGELEVYSGSYDIPVRGGKKLPKCLCGRLPGNVLHGMFSLGTHAIALVIVTPKDAHAKRKQLTVAVSVTARKTAKTGSMEFLSQKFPQHLLWLIHQLVALDPHQSQC